MSEHRTRFDIVSLAHGIALAVVCVFFLAVDDPDLEDVATLLFPILLLAAGGTLVVGSFRRDERDGESS